MGVPLAALSIQQQPNVLDQQAKALQLKNLAMQNQQQQIQLQDQQAGQRAMQQWDGKDFNDYVDLLRKNGASAQSVVGMQSHILDMHAKASQTIKNDADAAKMQFETQNDKNQHIAAGIDNVLQQDPDKQPQAFEAFKQNAVQNQWLDPQHAKAMNYQNPEQLQGLQKSLMGMSAFTADYLKKAEAEKDKQDAALAQLKVKQQSGLQSGAMDKQLDQIFPPTGKTTSGANQRYKSQANFFLQRGDLEGAKGVLSQASAEAGKTEEALNPDIQANKLALSKAEGAARANILLSPEKVQNEAAAAAAKASATAAATAGSEWKPKVTADEKKKAELAENISENATAVNASLAKRPDLVGAISGRFTNVEQMIGNNDPDISAIGNRIHNIAMANSGVHGFRSQEGVKETEANLLNHFKNGPEAVKGALGSNVDSVQTFIDNARPESYQTHSKQGGAGAYYQKRAGDSTTQHVAGGSSNGLKEGQTGKGSDGKPYVVKGGKWVAQ
jgi:hypothetical protein